MIRSALLSALALAALAPARADAQPPAPFGGGLRIVDAKVDKDKLTWNETHTVPVEKEVDVIKVVNGKQVPVKQKVLVYETVAVTRASDLKGVKATDGAGKAIGADRLAERLKEATPVVLATGAIPAKHRALFKDTTVFVELPAPELPKGAPVPAPPVVVPAPGGAPPVILPPGEKKG